VPSSCSGSTGGGGTGAGFGFESTGAGSSALGWITLSMLVSDRPTPLSVSLSFFSRSVSKERRKASTASTLAAAGSPAAFTSFCNWSKRISPVSGPSSGGGGAVAWLADSTSFSRAASVFLASLTTGGGGAGAGAALGLPLPRSSPRPESVSLSSLSMESSISAAAGVSEAISVAAISCSKRLSTSAGFGAAGAGFGLGGSGAGWGGGAGALAAGAGAGFGGGAGGASATDSLAILSMNSLRCVSMRLRVSPMNRWTVSRMTLSGTGFSMNSLAPFSCRALLRYFWPLYTEVAMITGTLRPVSVSLIFRQTSNPLILDSMAERSTTSGLSASNESRAAFPSCTVTTSKPASVKIFFSC